MEAKCPPALLLCLMYLFHSAVLGCISYNELVNVSIFLSSVSCSRKSLNPTVGGGKLQMWPQLDGSVGSLRTRVHLASGVQAVLPHWALNLWDPTLIPCRWCQKRTETILIFEEESRSPPTVAPNKVGPNDWNITFDYGLIWAMPPAGLPMSIMCDISMC